MVWSTGACSFFSLWPILLKIGFLCSAERSLRTGARHAREFQERNSKAHVLLVRSLMPPVTLGNVSYYAPSFSELFSSQLSDGTLVDIALVFYHLCLFRSFINSEAVEQVMVSRKKLSQSKMENFVYNVWLYAFCISSLK